MELTLGMNTADHRILNAIEAELEQASQAETQHEAMTRLLWVQHLLATLLRQMQDS